MSINCASYRSAERDVAMDLIEPAAVAPKYIVSLFLLVFLFFSSPVSAHRSYESYLTLSFDQQPELIWEIESNNLELLFNLDDNGNEIISWKELLNHQQEVLEYALNEISVRFDNQSLFLEVGTVEAKRRGDQTYLVVHFRLPDHFHPEKMGLSYNLFFNMDNQQRLLLSIHSVRGKDIYLLSPEENSIQVDITVNNLWLQVRQFVKEGVYHLFGGYDHVAFLLMLLLAHMSRIDDRNTMLISRLVKVVTAFSVAHTLTLFLAATDTVVLPIALVELVIAVTVMVSALSNALGRTQMLSWQVAFVFGLIHGFGFANVLNAIELQQNHYMVLLFSFNVGLEVGQLLLVSAVLPLLLWLRRFNCSFKRFRSVCSITTIALSFVWVLQRV